MKARREEDAIIADGHQEQGPGCRRWDFRCCGRNRADAGAQINGIQGFARLAPQLKLLVFAGEGRKIVLLLHEVNFYIRSLQVLSKQSLKGPCSVPWGVLWHSFVPASDLPLKRTMNIREPSFDQTGAHDAIFASGFLCIANYPMDFAPRRACSGPRHAPTPITRVGF
jgi:hypothetical protein